MSWFIFLCYLIASTAGFNHLRSPCRRFKFGHIEKSYNCDNVHSVNNYHNPHSAQADINNSRLIQIVNNNNNIQNQQQSASIHHQAGLQSAYVQEPIYNSYPGHNAQQFGNSAVASSSSVASSGSSSWNQQHGGNLVYPYGHVPAGGVAHSSSSSWSASSSG